MVVAKKDKISNPNGGKRTQSWAWDGFFCSLRVERLRAYSSTEVGNGVPSQEACTSKDGLKWWLGIM